MMLCAVLTLGTASAQAFFGSNIVFDPTLTAKQVAAEAARLGQTAQMIQNQINQYQMMIQNTLSLGDPVLKPLGDTLRSLSSVYYQGQNLMYRVQNLDSQFMYMYPGYQSYLYSMGQGTPTFSNRYQVWSDRNSEGIRASLKASGMVAESGESTESLLNRAALLSSTAGGQKQALQAGNAIAAMQVQELLKLQAMIDAQIKMQGNYLALENERRSMDDAQRANWRSIPFNKIPTQGF
jgi:P-type conjugative transfer protein TrbJ